MRRSSTCIPPHLRAGSSALLRLGARNASTSSGNGANSRSDSIVSEGTKAEKRKMDWRHLRRLFGLARPEARNLSFAIGLLGISSAVTMSVPFSMGKIIDIVTSTNSAQLPYNATYTGVFAGLTGIFFLGAVANGFRVYLMRVTGERIVGRLRRHLYTKMLREDIAFFDRQGSGELVSRLTVDTSAMGRALSQNISDGLRSVATAFASAGMMLYVSPQLTGIMALVIPPVAVSAIAYGRVVRRLAVRTQDAVSQASNLAEERLANVRTVQAFTQERKEISSYSGRIAEVIELARREAVASGVFYGWAGFSGNCTILAVLAAGGSLVTSGVMSVGNLTSFLIYTAYAGSSLMGLTSFYAELMKGVGAGERVFQLLDRPDTPNSQVGLVPEKWEGRIDFANISFAYPTRAESEVLKHFKLSIQPNTTIAIAGPSGCGKSTVASLLLRFYDPSAGQILLDGKHSLVETDMYWWRQQVAVVPQDPVLFSGTIRDNVLYSTADDVSDEALWSILESAGCAFIRDFPYQLNTEVGERGISLSGGQKQRVAIARALVRKPRLLVLDEATSALDGVTESLVQVALAQLQHQMTIVTIAHRRATLTNSDRVVVLDFEGRVVEDGGFTELMEREGALWHLMRDQQDDVSAG